jgi:hypothetical protein
MGPDLCAVDALPARAVRLARARGCARVAGHCLVGSATGLLTRTGRLPRFTA